VAADIGTGFVRYDIELASVGVVGKPIDVVCVVQRGKPGGGCIGMAIYAVR
jgi:hypothetical protein